MGKDEKKPLMQVIRENASAFAIFLYNSEEKTVLGRNSSSWGRISVFYLFYYAFLAALFAISITITYSLMPEEKPYYQTRLQTPGVTVQPKLPSKVAGDSDIIYSTKDGSIDGYGKYIDQLKTFLEGYDEASKNVSDSQFGPCANYTKAYMEGKPCIFAKINKIIDWTPIPFYNSSDEGQDIYNEKRGVSKAPTLDAWIKQQNIKYNPYAWVYVSCYGIDIKKTPKDETAAIRKLTTYPQGLPLNSYPYKGKSEIKSYQCPIMAIQFDDVELNTDIKVGCKAYAQNIYDEERINAGYIHFNMKICDGDTCKKA